jgi:RNA recognition motif-containing protein
VHSLQKNPEKNGSIGILGAFNSEKGRWAVIFDDHHSINFKQENLHLMPDIDASDKSEPPTAKLYITNLSASTTEEDLITLFGGIGSLAKSQYTRDKGVRKGSSKGFQDEWPYAVKLYKPGSKGGDASVEYADRLAAKAAVQTYNGYRLKDARIGVALAGAGQVFEKRELTLPWHLREENIGRIADNRKIHDSGPLDAPNKRA